PDQNHSGVARTAARDHRPSLPIAQRKCSLPDLKRSANRHDRNLCLRIEHGRLDRAASVKKRADVREELMRLFRHLLSAAVGALLFGAVLTGAPASAASGPEPKGKAVMAWHVTIAPAWFDPSSAPAQITPFGMLYAIHDAMVRPYPGQKMGPSLAESWQE